MQKKKQINKINSLSKEEEEEKNQNKSCNEGVLHDHGLFFFSLYNRKTET